jgi:Ca2+-binding EF-hand superfamily protein
MRNYRLAATFLLGTALVIVFAATSLGQLPPWFKRLDANGDGKVDRQEWINGGKRPKDFARWDRNGDGFITPDEAQRADNGPLDLKLKNGQVRYAGKMEENDEMLRGKKSYTLFHIALEKGQLYQVDLSSKDFAPFLFVEDEDGELAKEENGQPAAGDQRVVFRARQKGIYRIIATSQAGVRTGDFVLLVRTGAAAARGVPDWFNQMDTDGDGQLSLQEWLKAGKSLAEFRKFDRNDDGLVTAEEVLRFINKVVELKLKSGAVTYSGKLEERENLYKGSVKHYKLFNVKLEAGQNYHMEIRTQGFPGFLLVENPANGEILKVAGFQGPNDNSLDLVPATSEVYRLVAARMPGDGDGAFVLAIRTGKPRAQAKGLPAWFKQLDADGDGQISLEEWVKGGKPIAEFRQWDHNDDGFITAAEVLRITNRPAELEFEDDEAFHAGKAEEREEHRGKKSYQIVTVKLQGGEDYKLEMQSQAFQSFLYIETAEGQPLKDGFSDNVGGRFRLSFRPDHTATYRIVATSVGGFRTGDYELTVRHVQKRVTPKGVPAWFTKMDTDGDGQLSLQEWLKGGKTIEEFRKYDHNRDGLVTAEEVLRIMRLELPDPLGTPEKKDGADKKDGPEKKAEPPR